MQYLIVFALRTQNEIATLKVRDDFALKQVRSAARALLNSRENIPAERQRELEEILREFYKVDTIDEEVLKKGAFLIAT